MPILLAVVAAAAVLSVIASLGSGGGDLKKKLSDAVNPGGIKGAGGSAFFPGLGPSPGVGSGGSFTDTTTTAPGPAIGAPFSSQSSGMAAVFARLEPPEPAPAGPTAPGTGAITPIVAAPTPSPTPNFFTPSVPTSPVAPNVVQLAPQTLQAQPLPPEPLPAAPRGVQSPDAIERNQPAPAPYSIPAPGPTSPFYTPGSTVPSDPFQQAIPVPQTSSLAGTTSPGPIEWGPAPGTGSGPLPSSGPFAPPPPAGGGSGSNFDPGFMTSGSGPAGDMNTWDPYASGWNISPLGAYSAPNAGVSVAAPPGASGGNTLS